MWTPNYSLQERAVKEKPATLLAGLIGELWDPNKQGNYSIVSADNDVK